MNDRAWMYTGHPNQKYMTEEWLTKTEQFLEVAFSAGQPRTWYPFTRCRNYSRQTKDLMGKHLQMCGFMPDYTLWSFHGESAQCDRHEVVRQRIEDCGTGIEDMVYDYNDAFMRTKNRRKRPRPFMPCWSLQNSHYMRTPSFVN